MGRSASRRTRYQAHEQLATGQELARRCRTLPLEENRGRVMIALANPDNAQAHDAFLVEFGPESGVGLVDPLVIDARLAEVWGDSARRHLRLQVCAFPEPLPAELWNYAQALGTMLGADLGRMTTAGEVAALPSRAGCADCDLIIFGKGSHPLIRRVLSQSIAEDALSSRQCDAASAVLVAQEPRWPLERILLVLCGESEDNVALDWALRLACASSAAVTALAVVPPVPAMYHGLSRMEQSLRSLLTTDTALGRRMRHAARGLVESEVEGTLQLRQGPPEREMHWEIARGNYDLIVLGARPRRCWTPWLTGDFADSLLRRAKTPVLFARPITE